MKFAKGKQKGRRRRFQRKECKIGAKAWDLNKEIELRSETDSLELGEIGKVMV